jgi:hypothetical protein
MAEPAKELQIKIGTTADVAGAEQAQQALEGVAQAAEKAGASGGQASQEIGKVTEEQREAAQAALHELNKPAYSEQLKKILGDAKGAADGASRSMGHLKRSGEDVSRVFRGLQMSSAGGTRGVLGLLTAMQGLVGMFRRAGQLLLGPVGVALGAAAAGIAYLGKIANQNKEAIEKVFADAADGSERLKTAYADLEAEAEKSVAAQIEDVRRLAAAYDDLISRVDAAQKRMADSIKLQTDLKAAQLDRDEQRALAGARTDEDRERIRREFGGQRESVQATMAVAEIDRIELQAKQQRERAAEQLSAQQRLRDTSTLKARLARDAASGAVEKSSEVAQREGASSDAAKQAREDAKVLVKAADLAEEELAQIVAKTAEAMQRIQAEFDAANAALEQAQMGRRILATETETGALKATAEAKPQIAAARTAAEEAAARGDSAGQDKAVAELRALTAENNRREKQAGEQIAGLLKENFAVRAAKDEVIVRVIEKSTRRELNSREP